MIDIYQEYYFIEKKKKNESEQIFNPLLLRTYYTYITSSYDEKVSAKEEILKKKLITNSVDVKLEMYMDNQVLWKRFLFTGKYFFFTIGSHITKITLVTNNISNTYNRLKETWVFRSF